MNTVRHGGKTPRFWGKLYVLFDTVIPFLSGEPVHLRRSISHEWVERQGSNLNVHSKPWNSFRGGECGICWEKYFDKWSGVVQDLKDMEKSQNLGVAKLVLTHGACVGSDRELDKEAPVV